MTLFGRLLAKLRAALRQREPAAKERQEAKREEQSRVDAIFNLLRTEAERRAAGDNQERRHRNRSFGLDVATLVVSTITMGAVIYYAVVAAHQRDAMREQVKEMRLTNKLTQDAQQRTLEVVAAENRAWIGVKSSDLEIKIGKPAVANVQLINTGRTPALNVRARAGCVHGGNYSQTNVPPPGTAIGPIVILPNMQKEIPCVVDRQTTEADVAAFRNGTRQFIYAGTIEYTDRFGGAYVSTFCYFYHPKADSLIICNQKPTEAK